MTSGQTIKIEWQGRVIEATVVSDDGKVLVVK